ncbi:sulfurtransferase [Roseivirga sp. E12]|uniref:sulfurtransferase n=1 Tax=Roseivirga sp. E12 TaxID=2819237 RepID=UPI001ABC9040|nr:rhodanese-like domain-containing protein [Roseivirga sp. E12]MBO3698463.1 sulfurtransferase [Roseivirga sp. E12]
MKIRVTLSVLLLCFSFTDSYSQKKSSEIFVDQQWFQNHQSDDNLVILHVADPKSYEEGHIEGAISIIPPEYTVVRDGLYWELPEVSKMDSTLRSKGVNNDSQLVLYYGGGDHAATLRLFFTLDYFGLADRVRILDGGLKGWKANNLALSTDKPTIIETAPGKLKLKTKKKVKVDKKYARKSAGKDKINLIDARRDVFYNGTETGQYKRGGHIMGASNICWLDVVDENMFLKDKTVLAQMYATQGVKKGEQVVAYCHVGLRASTIYTIAKYLGFDARLYDGSFNEWDTLPDEYKVENGK